MQAPFDIAADLDTPVSAFLKLASLRPRFLLESVEGGERLARYSFLGFGDALEVRMDPASLVVDGETRPRPATQSAYRDALRDALALVDVRVLDHFVVAAGESVSFAERGLL